MFHVVEITGHNEKVFNYGRFGHQESTKDEVEQWLVDNCQRFWFYESLHNGRRWKFLKADHAILFKLTWGGK